MFDEFNEDELLYNLGIYIIKCTIINYMIEKEKSAKHS